MMATLALNFSQTCLLKVSKHVKKLNRAPYCQKEKKVKFRVKLVMSTLCSSGLGKPFYWGIIRSKSGSIFTITFNIHIIYIYN